MNLRFAAIITGCMLAGAAAAAYHRADSRPQTAPAMPLFMQAAAGAPTTAAWPPSVSVAFYDEMRTLVSTGPSPQQSQQQSPQQTPPARPNFAGGEPAPRGNGATPLPNGNDTVEIVIRDRFGRPIRFERVDRRMLAGPQSYPQQGYPRPPYGPPTQGPYGPYGPHGPYRR